MSKRALLLNSAALVSALVGALSAAPAALSRAPEATPLLRLGAGEHGRFSRITLNNAPASGWSAESRPRGLTLRLPGAGWRVDDSAVSRKRRAHRVSSVAVSRAQGETLLSFTFNCACEARPRVTADGLLMFDVRMRTAHSEAAIAEGAIATASTPEKKKDAAEPAAKTPETAPLDVGEARAFFLKQLERAASEGLIQYRDEDGAAERPAPEAAETPPVGSPAPGTEAAEAPKKAASAADPSSAKASKAKAPVAAAEATDPKAPLKAGAPLPAAPIAAAPAPATKKPAPAAPNGPAAAPSPKAAEAPGRPAATPHARKREGAETAAAEAAPAPLAEGEACPPEKTLNASRWPAGEPYFPALAKRRAALFDGLNHVDPAALAKLQKLYLANLFGPEAAAAPRAFRSDDPDVRLLAAMGAVLAERTPAPGGPFNRALPCPGRQALWQAAALAETEPRRAIQAFALGHRALLTAPSLIRRPLGSRIALAAAHIGETEIAAGVLALLDRTQLPPTPRMRLARAELALADDRVIAAQEELTAALETGGTVGVAAALRLSDTFREPHEASRALELADELADLSLLHRGAASLPALVKAEAGLRARYGQMRAGLNAIKVAQRYGDGDAQALEALRVSMLDAAVAAAGVPLRRDAASGPGASPGPASQAALERLAQSVSLISALEPGEENDRIRADLAERLIALGAPHLAPLLINDALAERSLRAAALRDQAEEAARLVDPLGAHGRDALASGGGGGALSDADVAAFFAQEQPSETARDSAEADEADDHSEPADALAQEDREDAASFETADAPAKRPAAPSEEAAIQVGAPAAPAPEVPVISAPPAARTIKQGQELLRELDEDLARIRAVALGQAAPPQNEASDPEGETR